ncbi:MAG TPA: hypothetical protein VF989_08730 [Polyangiaceae bacterium]
MKPESLPEFFRPIVFAALCLSFTACKRDPEPERGAVSLLPSPSAAPQSAPAVSPKPAPGDGGRPALPAAEITWEDPADWQRPPPKNAMRKANYVVPRAPGDSEDGELVVFYFGPSEGGDLEANVQRWTKQFSDIEPEDVKRADRTANGLRQHTVEIESGTYSSGMPGGQQTPMQGYALLGAIVQAPSGNYFFKLTAPEKTAKAARPSFYKLLDSAKPEG